MNAPDNALSVVSIAKPIKELLPVHIDCWECVDGKKHDSYADAAAANLADLLSGENAAGGGIALALAKKIIEKRGRIMRLLQSVDSEIAASKQEEPGRD